ncbi:hairy and enhancer of split-related protein HELT [Lampetra planeri]
MSGSKKLRKVKRREDDSRGVAMRLSAHARHECGGGTVSHKVIEKRRRDRINHCLNELGNTVPMALAKQSSGKLEKAEILEMTVQYLRALHSSDLLRGKEKTADLLREFSNYYQAGYQECLKNLVHYLTAIERLEMKDSRYLRVLAFLQAKARRSCPAGHPLAPGQPSARCPELPAFAGPGTCGGGGSGVVGGGGGGVPEAAGRPSPLHGARRAEPYPWQAAAPLPFLQAGQQPYLNSPGQQGFLSPGQQGFLSSGQHFDCAYMGYLSPHHVSSAARGIPSGQHVSL